MIKTEHFLIETYLPYMTVHCRFLPSDALLAILSMLPGISLVKLDGTDRYCINVFHGKAFSKEEIGQSIAAKIEAYLQQEETAS